MDERRTTIRVEGMTCPACSARVEHALSALPGVASAKVDLGRGKATLIYGNDGNFDGSAVASALAGAGYSLVSDASSGRAGSRSGFIAIAIGALLSAGYLILESRGAFSGIPEIGTGLSLGALFVAGLLTSVHCVSMCGGIALSQSLRSSKASRAARMAPGLLYNSGRVLGYALFGALAGGLGKALSFSNSVRAGLAFAAGAFMLVFGLRNLGVIRLPPIGRRLIPERARRALDRVRESAARGGPFFTGVLNALMPCGPLQAMQLYALGTGSAMMGALSMAVFALGTLPLMTGFAAAAGLMPRRLGPSLVKAGAVLTLALGFATFGRAAAFAGISLPWGGGGAALAAEPASTAKPSSTAGNSKVGEGAAKAAADRITRDRLPPDVPVAAMGAGIQAIETVFTSNAYAPFAVVSGVPVRWTIKIAASELNGCNRSIIVPAYRIKKDLKPGDNLIEFTPKASGVVSYSCWMGMIRSAFAVLDE